MPETYFDHLTGRVGSEFLDPKNPTGRLIDLAGGPDPAHSHVYVYHIMNDFIQIFSCDVKIYSVLIFNDFFIQSFLADSLVETAGSSALFTASFATFITSFLRRYSICSESSF